MNDANGIRWAWRLMSAIALVLAAASILLSVVLFLRVEGEADFVRDRQRVVACRLIDTKQKQIASNAILDDLIASVQRPGQRPATRDALLAARVELARERTAIRNGIRILRGELSSPCPPA